MGRLMDVPVLGLVENMSYFVCPDCNKKHFIFGKNDVNETAEKFGISSVATLPIDKNITDAVDSGKIEEFDAKDLVKSILDAIE